MIRYLLIIWLFAVQPVFGQRLYFTSYPLIHKNVQQGVHIVDRDHEGLMWVVSSNQLYTFDGMVYNPIDLPGDGQQKITALSCSSSGQSTWVGLENGILLNNTNDVFEVAEIENGPTNVAISTIILDENEWLWVASYGSGVFVKDKESVSFQRVKNLESQDVYSMISGPNGEIWLSTDKGIASCTLFENEIQTQSYTAKDGLQDEVVKDMEFIDGDLLLATHEAGLIRFGLESKKFKSLTPNWSLGAIRSLEKYNDHECWIVTERNGVFTFNLSTNQLNQVIDKSGVKLNQVTAIKINSDGSVWLCDANASLLRALRYFEFYSPAVNDIQMIYPKNEQSVFLGTNNGLFFYSLTEDQSRPIKATKGYNIISMDQIGAHLLLGTFDDGLIIVNLQDESIKTLTENDGLANNSIITLAHTEHELLLSTLAGVCHVKYKLIDKRLDFEEIQKFDLLTNDYVYDILLDQDETIYFATDGHGVAQLQEGRVKYYNQDSIAKSQIISIAKGQNSAIWAIENSAGVCVLDHQRSSLATDVFTTGPDVLAISSDGISNMIVLHRDGLDLIDEANGELLSYDVESGFESFQPLLNGLVKCKTSCLFAASNSELVKILPAEKYGERPRLLINFVKVGDRKLDPSKSHKLEADEHTLYFNLTGLYYANPESIGLRYKLEGHDETWKETQDQNIIYSKLPPGTYSFLAQAISTSSVYQDAQSKTFRFEIMESMHQRWWFIAGVLLIGLLLAFAIMKYRERLLLREKELQNAVIERQYEVLKNQLNPHFLFNAFNNLIGYIEEDPKTAVTVVERLSDFYRRILELKEYKLVTITQELDLLSDYVFLLNKRFGGSLFVDVQIKEPHAYIPPMTLQILVENAVKHNVLSERYPLHIVIKDFSNESIEVFNEKRTKRTASTSTGIGLQNISKRYRLLGEDEIEIVDENGVFKVIIPKIKINKQ